MSSPVSFLWARMAVLTKTWKWKVIFYIHDQWPWPCPDLWCCLQERLQTGNFSFVFLFCYKPNGFSPPDNLVHHFTRPGQMCNYPKNLLCEIYTSTVAKSTAPGTAKTNVFLCQPYSKVNAIVLMGWMSSVLVPDIGGEAEVDQNGS